MSARSAQAQVRNPLLALPSAAALADLPDDAKAALSAVLADIRRDAQARADESWRKHKGPMAAYWKAVAVYAGHTRRALR